ncbi:hypothetical protein [Pseudomonas koreensis]|uniref:hypothetical protein n=1 Tax=Pseudomonas koreensis TaxID=198620 RepID=UPI002659FAE1|nr:hypothetical protein [Pseudomonas koreensis]
MNRTCRLQYLEALASVASGEVTSCREYRDGVLPGVYETLFLAGLIQALQLPSQGMFSLVDMSLTDGGHSALTTLISALESSTV